MADARYFVPDHASLKDVYSKDDLRGLLQAGKLSRSDIVIDDQTGLAHLLGDLLMTAYRETRVETVRATAGVAGAPPPQHEFRANTPLPRPETQPEEDAESGFAPEEELEETIDEPEAETLPTGDGVIAAPAGEGLLYHGHPSWLAYPKSVLALFGFGTAAWLFHRLHAEFAWVIVSGSLAVLPLLFVSLDRATTSYFITSRRVEMEFGILGRSTKEVRIADIRAIDVEQRGYQAVVGIGNVKFDSAAGSNAEVEFNNVRRPHALKQAVRELQG